MCGQKTQMSHVHYEDGNDDEQSQVYFLGAMFLPLMDTAHVTAFL